MDLLSKLSVDELEQLSDEVYLQLINTPTFERTAPVMHINKERSWIISYLEYVEVGKLPEDKAKAQKIATKAANYQTVRETLYRRENPARG